MQVHLEKGWLGERWSRHDHTCGLDLKPQTNLNYITSQSNEDK